MLRLKNPWMWWLRIKTLSDNKPCETRRNQMGPGTPLLELLSLRAPLATNETNRSHIQNKISGKLFFTGCAVVLKSKSYQPIQVFNLASRLSWTMLPVPQEPPKSLAKFSRSERGFGCDATYLRSGSCARDLVRAARRWRWLKMLSSLEEREKNLSNSWATEVALSGKTTRKWQKMCQNLRSYMPRWEWTRQRWAECDEPKQDSPSGSNPPQASRKSDTPLTFPTSDGQLRTKSDCALQLKERNKSGCKLLEVKALYTQPQGQQFHTLEKLTSGIIMKEISTLPTWVFQVALLPETYPYLHVQEKITYWDCKAHLTLDCVRNRKDMRYHFESLWNEKL